MGLSLTFWFSIDREIMRLSIMFPKAMILIMALISVLLLIKGFMKAERQNLFDVGSNLRVAVTGLFFFTWGVAIAYLGFFVASVAAIFAMTGYLATARRQLNLSVLAIWLFIVIGEVAFFYLIFTQLLHVPLPEGIFF
ncbi:MAG: hypothetical protein AMJ54_08325 [Deltaproteobacteria bacterium SG8_13]|nr:MAG: hypothetical protein AMJ54_08325 [Deltaproteobacteria bacterium SG8_13]